MDYALDRSLMQKKTDAKEPLSGFVHQNVMKEQQQLRWKLAMIPVNIACFALLALGFWLLSRWQFRKAYC